MNKIDEKFKYFKYTRNFNITNRYQALMLKSNINFLKDLKYKGFEVLDKADYSVTFKINVKLIRKLKILSLSDNVDNGVEQKLLKLIEKSTFMPDYENDIRLFTNSNWYSNTSRSSGTDGYYREYSDEEKDLVKDRKKFANKQSKIYNQKIKQYENKKWLRKQ